MPEFTTGGGYQQQRCHGEQYWKGPRPVSKMCDRHRSRKTACKKWENEFETSF